jgi:hypothetical protein
MVDCVMREAKFEDFAIMTDDIIASTKTFTKLKTLRLDRGDGFSWRTTQVKRYVKKKRERRAFYDKDGRPQCLSTSLLYFDSCYFFDSNLLPVAFPNLKGATIPSEIFERKFVLEDNPFRFNTPTPNIARISTPVSIAAALPRLARW